MRICERRGCGNLIDPLKPKVTRFCSRSCRLRKDVQSLTRVCLLDGCDETFETTKNKMFCSNKHRLRYKKLHPDSEFRIWDRTLDNFNKTNNKSGLGTMKIKKPSNWDGCDHVLSSDVRDIFNQHGYSGVATGRVTGPWIDQHKHDKCSMELLLHYFPNMKEEEKKLAMRVISCKERNLFFDTMNPYEEEGRIRNHFEVIRNEKAMDKAGA